MHLILYYGVYGNKYGLDSQEVCPLLFQAVLDLCGGILSKFVFFSFHSCKMSTVIFPLLCIMKLKSIMFSKIFLASWMEGPIEVQVFFILFMNI